jgi:hypothetical protein
MLSVPLTFPLTVNEAVVGAPVPRMKAPCAFRQKLTVFPPAVVGGLLKVPQKLMVFPEKALVAVNMVFSRRNVSCALTSSAIIFAVPPGPLLIVNFVPAGRMAVDKSNHVLHGVLDVGQATVVPFTDTLIVRARACDAPLTQRPSPSMAMRVLSRNIVDPPCVESVGLASNPIGTALTAKSSCLFVGVIIDEMSNILQMILRRHRRLRAAIPMPFDDAFPEMAMIEP